MSIRRVRWLGVLLPLMLWMGVLVVRASLSDKVSGWVEWGAELVLVGAGCLVFANWVAGNFEAHQREMNERAQQLEALRQAGIALTTETDLEPLLQRVVDVSRSLAGARYAALGVLDEAGTTIEQFIFSGMEPSAKALIGSHPMAKGLLGMLLQSSEPVRIDSIADDARAVGFPANHIPMRTLLGVALRVRGKVLGNLYLADKIDASQSMPVPFTDMDARTLEMFATHASIAIENARLKQQNQQLAIIQERERFGMNMHDGIIQSIYALGLILDDAEHRVEQDPATASQEIRQSVDGLNQVIRDIRAYIMDLRPQRFEDASLQQGMENLVQNLAAHWSLHVSLKIDPEAAAVVDALGSSVVKQRSELLHIVQEALTNIHKHARASTVQMTVTLDEAELVTRIQDNGMGFDVFQTARTSKGNGLRNMQQRARALNGDMEVISQPGVGTSMTLTLPLPSAAASISRAPSISQALPASPEPTTHSTAN